MLRLKAERLRLGKTLVDLGFVAGVAPGRISEYERGRVPGPVTATKLAAALNISLDELLVEVDESDGERR